MRRAVSNGNLAPVGGTTGKWRLPGEGTHSPLGVWPWKVASVPGDVHRPMCTWEGLIGLGLLITNPKNYYRTWSWVGVTAQERQEVGDWTNTHSKNKKNIKTKKTPWLVWMLLSSRHRYRDQWQNGPVVPKEHHTSAFNPILTSTEPCLLTFFFLDLHCRTQRR